jgi:hypothetical protein
MIKLSGKIAEIIPEMLKLDMKKLYTVEIKEPKSKRSLEQNRMLWQLIHSIAKKHHQDDMEVYCALLERADAKSDYIITAYDMEDDLRKCFRGVRFVRKQEVNGKECNIYKVYIGSSKMNTKEMTELLDIALQLCDELGIPTMEFDDYG